MSTYDYSSLGKVKSIIRTTDGDPSVQKKVKFSDAHSLPKKHSGNNGSGMLLDITIATSYVGLEHWKVLFTSATEFTLYRGEDELVTDGNGVTGSQFASDSKIITIKTIHWTGTPQSGDSFTFKTESNMSNEDAEEFISDAEDVVNSMLEEHIGSVNVPFKGNVPRQIDGGTAYIAAHLIYGSIFSATNQGDLPEFVRTWFRWGRNLISSYIETISGTLLRKAMSIPRFIGREPLFDKVGIQDVQGIGLAVGDDHGKVEAQDLEFDKFFNTEEGGD